MPRVSVPTNGDAIRAIRQAKGWSAAKFADRIGVSQPYLSRIETGKRSASPTVLRRIADTLDVPVAAVGGPHSVDEVA